MGWASVVNGGLKFLENLKCGKSDGLIHGGIYVKTTSDGGDRMWCFEATTNDNPSEYFLSLKLLTAKYRSFDKIQEDDSQRQSFGLEPGSASQSVEHLKLGCFMTLFMDQAKNLQYAARG